MKKKYTLVILLLTFLNVNNVFSQVGIGTTAPDARLDIRSSNQATPANNDGILIPKVDVFPVTNPTVAQQGMLVYLTTATTFGGNPKAIGFYYWDNPTTDWIAISSAANGDHDWYEEGTTVAPNAITDDMFHAGNVAIGKNTADYPLEVNTTAFDTGINNLQVNNSNNLLKAIENTVSGTGTGSHYGVYNTLSGTGTGAQFGISNNISNSTDDVHYGIYNLLSGNGTGSHYGNWNSLQSNGNGFQYGNYNEITNTGTGSHFGNNNILSGTGVGDQFTNYNTISNTGLGNHYGNYTLLNGTGIGLQYANLNTISNSGNGIHYGNYNVLNGSGTGNHYGNSIELNGTGTGNQFGNYTHIDNSGNGSHYGNYNLFDDSGSGARVGFLANLTGTNTGAQYGLDVTIDSPGNFNHYGSAIRMGGTGTGFHWANYTIIAGVGNGGQAGFYSSNTNSGNGTHYGAWNIVQGTGTGIKYGSYNIIPTTAGGTHYGIYSEVLKPGATNFAGYFLGNVGIGTTIANTYTLPPSRGTNGQVMRTNGTGVVTWANNSDFAWSLNGNAALATDFIGTTNAQPFRFYTNNIERMRISNVDGEVVVGAIVSPYTVDLLSAVSSTTVPFAVNGYSSFNGSGVWGEIRPGNTTTWSGVDGRYGGSGLGNGVTGVYAGSAVTGLRMGVQGLSNNGFGNQQVGVLGNYNGAAWGVGVYGIGFGGGIIAGNNDIAVVGWRANNANFSGYFNGNHVIANGTKTASVGTSKGNQLLYVTELPEVWFEDVGGGQLVNGSTHIQLDPMFLETIFVDQTHPMRIFLQEEGESNGLIVIKDIDNKGFVVKEKNGGTSNISFSFRIMAKRLHFQDHRFGNDPLWGEGDTRQYNQYATPPPVDYNENVRFQEEQKKNYKPTPMPKGFIDYFQLQEEAKKLETKKTAPSSTK